MTTFSLSNAPSSTLFPGLSPQQDPNYNNAFQVDFNTLRNNTSPIPDYAKQFAINSQNLVNRMKADIGLTFASQGSPNTQFLGKEMLQQSIDNKPTFVNPTKEKIPFSTKFMNSTFGKNSTQWNSAYDMANNIVTSIFGEKDEYSGSKGHITRTMDNIYDNIKDTANNFGPIGMAVSQVMGASEALGNLVNGLGGGTDGMCVCAGTKVFKANGEIINIEDLKQEDGIIGWNEKTKQIVPQTIHNIIEPRQKECLEITIKSGFTLRCSIDHPVLSDNSPKARSHRINGQRIAYRDWKFRRADELKVGDFVGVANNIDYWGNITLDKAYLIGLLIGDGTYTKGNSCRLFSADRSTWDYIESNGLGVINHCDDTRSDKYSTEVRTYRIIDGMDLMRQVGLVYQSGENKTLPKNIGQYTKDSICQLLAGLYDTDGSISVNEDKNNWSITLCQSNKNLLQEVKEQLHKLGIFTSINTRKAAKYQLGGRIINSKQSYRLQVGDITSAIKFTQLIPLNIDYKKANLDRIYNLLKDKKAQEHPELSGAKQFKIVDIKPIGIQTVYNLQADNDHTYLANGIITHNTTTDAVLGSAFLQLTPFGLINGFGGKKADTITKNDEVFETIGSSYTGTNQTVNDALTKSGKKYGLFSGKARRNANNLIQEAKRQQEVMEDISDEATDRFAIRNSMAAINGNRRAYILQGGYDQSNVRVGRNGMNIELLNRARKVVKQSQKLQTGGVISDPFEVYLQSLPQAQRDSTNFRVRDYWEYNGRPKNFDEARKKGMFEWKEDFDESGKSLGWSWHAFTVAKNPNADEYDFMKSSSHPTVQKEIDWYNSDAGSEFRKEYELQKVQPYYKYVKRKAPYKDVPVHKGGGSIIELVSLPTEILLVDPNEVPEFQQGGSINVIPDGALHARKHNMDMEGITKKGIPVIDNDGEQQAEIECEELIIRLEVTKKLEELEKKFYDSETSQKEKDECALEAGKLLVEEILYNTQDNTKSLL